MPILTRRTVALSSLCVASGLLAQPARAAAPFRYKGWTFDASEVKGELSEALVASFQAQIDIVESLAIKPEIKAFFRSVPCRIDLKTPGGPGAYGFERDRMLLSTTPQPKDNPVFLHELLHAYHDQRLPKGLKNEKVIAHLKAAQAMNHFPPKAYMLSNAAEFFAMCSSVVLWGRASRPPATRENVRKVLPETYAFIVEEFGWSDAPPAARAG